MWWHIYVYVCIYIYIHIHIHINTNAHEAQTRTQHTQAPASTQYLRTVACAQAATHARLHQSDSNKAMNHGLLTHNSRKRSLLRPQRTSAHSTSTMSIQHARPNTSSMLRHSLIRQWAIRIFRRTWLLDRFSPRTTRGLKHSPRRSSHELKGWKMSCSPMTAMQARSRQ